MMNSIGQLGTPYLAMPVGTTPTPPSQPAPEAPTDGLTLDDYKPSLGDYAKVAVTPVVWGGAAAFAGTFNVVAQFAGGAVGVVVGTTLGIAVGRLIDKVTGNAKHAATIQGGGAGAFLGALGGGWGAGFLPPQAAVVALGIAGLGVGVAAAIGYKHSLAKNVAKEVDKQATAGTVHVSRLFRQIYDRDGQGDAGVARDVRACEQLEGHGWHVAVGSATMQAHVTKQGSSDVQVIAPDGGKEFANLSALPYLSYLSGIGGAGDVADSSLADAVKNLAARGRSLHVKGWNAARPSDTPQAELVRQASACDALTRGQGASCVHDGVAIEVDAKDAASLEAAMKTADDVFAKYDAHLAPAFASGLLNGESKTNVLQTLLKSPAGGDLSRTAPLFVKLAEAQKSQTPYDRTSGAISIFEDVTAMPRDRVSFEQAIDDACSLSKRMSPRTVTDTLRHMADALSTVDAAASASYHDGFMRLLRCTGDNIPLTSRAVQILSAMDDSTAAEVQLSALEKLAEAGAAQPGYSDLTLDNATLMATRNADEPIATSAARYARLLGGLAAQGKAEEAAPTFAFIRAALSDGTASGSDEDALVDRMLASVTAGSTVDAARASLLLPGTTPATQDVAALEQRLQGPLGTRAHRGAQLMASLPSGEVEAQVSIMEALARSASAQKDYGDVLLDYTALMGVRDHNVPLQTSVEQYGTLLSCLASQNQATEAAPTYAFMQGGLARGRFGTQTFDQLCEKFMTSLVTNGDVRHARQTLLQAPPQTTDTTVKKDDDFVIIGGVAVPVRR